MLSLPFQRPATTHELFLELDDAAVGATAKADGGCTVQPPKGEEDRPKFRQQPLTVAGIDSSCSTLVVSPPPPMRVFSSGGQSSAYAALKAMNADDPRAAGGLSGAHLIRTDKKGLEGVSASSKYLSLFPAASTASQGLSSLPHQSTVGRHPAAAEGPPSLDSIVVTTEVGQVHSTIQPTR